MFFFLMISKWKVSSGEKFDNYMDFVKKIANTTYENLENMTSYVNNTELMSIDIIDLMLKVMCKLMFVKNLKLL